MTATSYRHSRHITSLLKHVSDRVCLDLNSARVTCACSMQFMTSALLTSEQILQCIRCHFFKMNRNRKVSRQIGAEDRKQRCMAKEG